MKYRSVLFVPGHEEKKIKKALNGKYNLPKGPGLGIDLDYKRLSKYEI